MAFTAIDTGGPDPNSQPLVRNRKISHAASRSHTHSAHSIDKNWLHIYSNPEKVSGRFQEASLRCRSRRTETQKIARDRFWGLRLGSVFWVFGFGQGWNVSSGYPYLFVINTSLPTLDDAAIDPLILAHPHTTHMAECPIHPLRKINKRWDNIKGIKGDIFGLLCYKYCI